MLPEKSPVTDAATVDGAPNSPQQSKKSPTSQSSSHEQQSSSPSPKLDSNPPLPLEEPPPLPDEEPSSKPAGDDDDGWEPVWDDGAQSFYFYNRLTKITQWENPRIPEATEIPVVRDLGPPGASQSLQPPKRPAAGGYDPAIHGDYDPDADYAKLSDMGYGEEAGGVNTEVDPTAAYAATGTFNRFTGKWQSADLNPEKFSDENKSKRQMNAFFDVDAAANAHDGKSLKAERSSKKLSKRELKAFKEKRRERKEEKRRAWLRD